MKSNYILIPYNNYSFKTTLSVCVQNIDKSAECKIDTGCMKTCIPIKRLGVSDTEALKLKQDAINCNCAYSRSYGVSDTQANKDKDTKMINNGDLLHCTSLRFTHTASKFIIAGFDMSNIDIGINYDRVSNILIGMDILSKMDIHIGKSKIQNEIIFLACPYDKINDDYLLALESHFGTGTAVNSALVRKLL